MQPGYAIYSQNNCLKLSGCEGLCHITMSNSDFLVFLDTKDVLRFSLS